MSRPHAAVFGIVLLGLLVTACSGGPSEPEQAVQEFYSRLNRGDYSGAKALYDAEARKLLDDPDLASDSGFAEWAKQETKQGKVDRVEVLSQSGDDSTMTVECEVVYTDGTTRTRSVSLTREGGQWKLGLLG